MNGINCDGEGGWTRIGYLNMSQSGATCPTGLIQQNFTNISHPLCGRLATGPYCASTNFSSNGLTYNKVCGQVRGYQFSRTRAFDNFQENDLISEDFTVDGVSITHGSNPRKHIWTYAAGHRENRIDTRACPCNTGYSGGLDLNATFIGSYYYCESGVDPGIILSNDVLYANDPLWDGQQCDDAESTCCPANSKIPWFYRSLDTQTSDDIELRVCTSRGSPGASDAPLDIIELYIK